MAIYTTVLSASSGAYLTGSIDLTGSFKINDEAVATGDAKPGNYETLQSDLTVAADFRQVLYGPVDIPVGKKMTIEDTGKAKIKNFDDV